MRLAGVVRVSTSGQGLGAKAQASQLRVWAKREGHELVSIHQDLGISGDVKLTRRPGLKAAIHDVADGRAQALLAAEPSRFARAHRVWIEVLAAVYAVGGVLMTIDGTLTGADTREADLQLQVAILQSSIESRLHKDRNRRRVQECVAQGRLHGGPPPFGWRRRADGRTSSSGRVVDLEEDPDEQAAIARMAALRSDGHSFEGIALLLTSEGFKPRGVGWKAASIRRAIIRYGK